MEEHIWYRLKRIVVPEQLTLLRLWIQVIAGGLECLPERTPVHLHALERWSFYSDSDDF